MIKTWHMLILIIDIVKMEGDCRIGAAVPSFDPILQFDRQQRMDTSSLAIRRFPKNQFRIKDKLLWCIIGRNGYGGEQL